MAEERNVWFGRMDGKSGKLIVRRGEAMDDLEWASREFLTVPKKKLDPTNYRVHTMADWKPIRICSHRFGRLHQTGEPGRCWMLCHKCGGTVFGTEERLKEEKRAWQK